MSLRTQAKVLRVLQEREVERIGSQKKIDDDQVKPEHLADVLAPPVRGAGPGRGGRGHPPRLQGGAPLLVQRLRENSWNISATATAMGAPRSNLCRKLESCGISQEKDG